MDIFLVWNNNADSWSGVKTLKSIFTTYDKALADIPSDLHRYAENRTLYGREVFNCAYYSIEKRVID